jgi:hypothetical protein
VTVELPVAVPSNRFLTPQRDRRWLHVLSAVLLVSVVVLSLLFLVGWPRLRSTSIHYQLIRLRAEVEDLERHRHRLQVELERQRSPVRLGQRASDLGLRPPDPGALVAGQGGEGPP